MHERVRTGTTTRFGGEHGRSRFQSESQLVRGARHAPPMTSISELITERLDEPAELQQGIPTGLRELDAATGGLMPGRTWLITGPAGVGRSTLALQLARRS